MTPRFATPAWREMVCARHNTFDFPAVLSWAGKEVTAEMVTRGYRMLVQHNLRARREFNARERHRRDVERAERREANAAAFREMIAASGLPTTAGPSVFEGWRLPSHFNPPVVTRETVQSRLRWTDEVANLGRRRR